MLERTGERIERWVHKYSPPSGQGDPSDPEREADVPNEVHSAPGGSRRDSDERNVEANAPHRDIGRGGQERVQDELGHVERNWERETDGEGVQGVQEHPESAHVERVNNPRLRCRDPEPGGRLGEQVEPDDVGGDCSHENDGDGVGEDGRRCWMDDATSGARCDSRRVETRPLAREQADQHGQQEREPADVPEPSTPSQTTPRRHTNHPNPPQRHGKLKTSSRNVSQTRVHKRTHRNRTATSRPIQRVEAMRMRSNGI